MTPKLKYQPPGVHFAVFFALAVGMFMANLLISDVLFGDILAVFRSNREISPEMVSRFKWMQFAAAIMTFVIPPVLYGYLASERPFNHIGLKREVRVQPAVATILLLIAVQPFAMLMGELNQQANFGAAHEIVKSTEEMYEKIMSQFLVMDTPVDLLINMVLVALLPAVGEELFFRGCLQNILERWTRSPVVAIGLASLGFALLHGTFLKFLPIFILGIVLGTILYVTRNLWYSVLFHFLNNAMALVASYYAQRNEFMKQLADDDLKLNWWMGLASLLVTVAIFIYLRKRIPYQPLQRTEGQPPFHDHTNIPR